MTTARSADGTLLAYESRGEGPPLILVDGALCSRAVGPSAKLAQALAARFTVITYDRRGRGESGHGSAPYAAEREIEDIAALIADNGGAAFVCGVSSGAVLALDAAAAGLPITGLAAYEPPFIVDGSRAPMPADYAETLNALLASDRRGDAVRLFMRNVGMPAALASLMRLSPVWRKLKRVAHTLPYDAAIMGDTQSGRPLPAERWLDAEVKTVVIVGGKSPEFFHNGTRMLVGQLPSAEHRVLPGQTHMVKAKALAPLLIECFAAVPSLSARTYA
jgi:pimeloyl-ACP methyl ester carboxylesterase